MSVFLALIAIVWGASLFAIIGFALVLGTSRDSRAHLFGKTPERPHPVTPHVLLDAER